MRQSAILSNVARRIRKDKQPQTTRDDEFKPHEVRETLRGLTNNFIQAKLLKLSEETHTRAKARTRTRIRKTREDYSGKNL